MKVSKDVLALLYGINGIISIALAIALDNPYYAVVVGLWAFGSGLWLGQTNHDGGK